MSEHIIRQNKDRANPLREPKVNEVYLYTISSRQDYEDEDGNKVYDYEEMANEFENKLSEISGVTVMCSVSEDIIYED